MEDRDEACLPGEGESGQTVTTDSACNRPTSCLGDVGDGGSLPVCVPVAGWLQTALCCETPTRREWTGEGTILPMSRGCSTRPWFVAEYRCSPPRVPAVVNTARGWCEIVSNPGNECRVVRYGTHTGVRYSKVRRTGAWTRSPGVSARKSNCRAPSVTRSGILPTSGL